MPGPALSRVFGLRATTMLKYGVGIIGACAGSVGTVHLTETQRVRNLQTGMKLLKAQNDNSEWEAYIRRRGEYAVKQWEVDYELKKQVRGKDQDFIRHWVDEDPKR